MSKVIWSGELHHEAGDLIPFRLVQCSLSKDFILERSLGVDALGQQAWSTVINKDYEVRIAALEKALEEKIEKASRVPDFNWQMLAKFSRLPGVKDPPVMFDLPNNSSEWFKIEMITPKSKTVRQVNQKQWCVHSTDRPSQFVFRFKQFLETFWDLGPEVLLSDSICVNIYCRQRVEAV